MTLYEIDSRLASLIDEETGELLDYEAFEQLQIERESKLENTALWYKDLMAQAAAIKAEADALTERRKSAERTAERLKEYLGRALDGEKFSTPRCEVTFRRSTALEVEDPADLIEWAKRNGHDECITYKAPEVSKKAVTALLKSGMEVPHAQLVQKLNVGVK